MENVENYIIKKVESILTSPSYSSLSGEKKEEMRAKMENHLERMVIETFINRLTDEEAEKLNDLMKRKPKEAHEKLKELSFSRPELAKDIEERLDREVKKFKSLKGNSHGE